MAGRSGGREKRRNGQLTMILRFLRRSSLNGDSWSIAIPSLPRDASSLPPRRPFFSRGGRRRRASRVGWAEVAAVPAASRCGARAEAARRGEATGGKEMRAGGQAGGASKGGTGRGLGLYARVDSARGGESQRVAVCYCWEQGVVDEGGHPAVTASALVLSPPRSPGSPSNI